MVSHQNELIELIILNMYSSILYALHHCTIDR